MPRKSSFLTVADLISYTGTETPSGSRPSLYCACGASYSADAGDYFMSAPDTKLICNHPRGMGSCRLVRAIKRTSLEEC